MEAKVRVSLIHLNNLFLACSLCLGLLTADTRLAHLTIFKDGPSYENVGFHNLSMESNGEKMVLSTILDSDIVFDVGAHVGDWSLAVLEHEPKVKIFAFEPIADLSDVFKQRLQGYRESNICLLSNSCIFEHAPSPS